MTVTYDIDESKQLAEEVSIGPEIVVPEHYVDVQFSETSIMHLLMKMKDVPCVQVISDKNAHLWLL